MSIRTPPYDTTIIDEDTDDGWVQERHSPTTVESRKESFVTFHHSTQRSVSDCKQDEKLKKPCSKKTCVKTVSVHDMERIPSSSHHDEEEDVSSRTTNTQNKRVSTYDLWLLQSSLKTDTTSSTEVGRDHPVATDVGISEFSSSSSPSTRWRHRRNRRRLIISAIMLFLGFLILTISLAVLGGGANGREIANLSDEDDIPIPGTPSRHPDDKIAQSVVLDSNNFLEGGAFIYSPNEQYKAGLSHGGSFMLKDRHGSILWSTETNGGERLFMQTDGNLVLKSASNKSVWTTETHANPGAVLVVDDEGMVAIVNRHGTKVWIDGIPRGVYEGPSPTSGLTFPTRGIFYYPWFPATFELNGEPVKFESDLGRYSSSDPAVARAHVDAMDYGDIDLAIASWWGPDTHLDRSRLTMLMDETIAMGSTLKWTVYHEDAQDHPTMRMIRDDLDYLKKWFAWHPTWAHVDGRPVIFAYNEDGCDVIDRWMDASNGEWFVVLKIFPKFKECERQPDHWHQYGVNQGKPLQYDNFMFSLSPGFWRADENKPQTPRVRPEQWCENVQEMASSKEPWHLIISFNEAGEGTNIEPSPHWESASGYGEYLDCLHEFPTKRPIQNRARISNYGRNRTLTVHNIDNATTLPEEHG